MTEYFDLAADDDLDPFGREVTPLQALEQDLGHMLTDPHGSHIMSPDWGIGLEDYLGKPIPSTLASIIVEAFERDDRVYRAECTVTQTDTRGESFEVRVRVQAQDGFLEIARTIERNANALPPASPVVAPPETPAPFILSATSVPASGGTSVITFDVTGPATSDVVITGVGITLGATTFVNATTVNVAVPAHAAGTFNLLATQASGGSGASGNAKLTVTPLAPVLSALAPTTVSTAGGDPLVLTGSGFIAPEQIEIDGTLYSVTHDSATQLTKSSTPAHPAGSVSVRARNADGQYSGALSLVYASPYVDPVTLTPSGYWEQRGDANDYSLANGIWAKRSTTGSNWVQGIQAGLPAVGALVDGKAPWYPHADNTHGLDNAGSWATYGSTTQLAGSLLLYIPSGLGPYGSYANQGPSIFGDVINQQYWTLAAGTQGGLTYVGISLYDGAIKDARVQVTPDTWLQFNFRANAGVLAVSVNAAPSTGTALSTFTNNAFSLTSHTTAVACPGVAILSKFLKLTIADADFGTIRNWWRGVTYPSLAGVLPA